MRPGGARGVCSEKRRVLSAIRVDVVKRVGICMLERVESRQAQALGDDQTRSLRVDGWSSCKHGAGE